MEAKYIAATCAVKEVLWLYTFLVEIAWPLKQPITIHFDNVSAVAITKNDKYHPRTKQTYTTISCHTIQQKLVQVDYVPTDDMAVDIHKRSLKWRNWSACAA